MVDPDILYFRTYLAERATRPNPTNPTALSPTIAYIIDSDITYLKRYLGTK
jgi:hypothetical protein